jgi:hypothetical protein
MKTKVELGKYYNHNPNHFRFARTCDMGSSYVSIDSDKEQSWVGVIFGLILIISIISVLYYFGFYSVEIENEL